MEKELRSRQWFGRKGKDGFIYRAWMKNQGIPAHEFQGKPVIGICNTWSELTPCNAHFRELAESVKHGIYEAGGFPVEFPVMSLGETLIKPTAMLYRNLVSMDVEESIRANPLATFLVSDFLAFTPHHFVDPRDGGRATLHFRAVAFECEATRVSTEPAEVAGALSRLLAAYEPEDGYEEVRDGAFYGSRLRRLATLRLRVLRTDAKFKTGPAAGNDIKRQVVARLRERSAAGDGRAARVLESHIRD